MTLRALLAWPRLRLRMMRVGRGFTVHSPFAYHFIKCCLRERLPYYAFRRDVTSRAGRRLFRVVAYLCPSTVCCLGPADEARRIIALACPWAREVDEGAEFTYVGAGTPLPADFRALYVAHYVANPPSDAMTFSNRKVMIAIRRRGLPPQSFLLKF